MSVEDLEIGQVTKALEGITFPARKSDLIDRAKANGADETIVGHLAGITDEEYTSITGVVQAVRG